MIQILTLELVMHNFSKKRALLKSDLTRPKYKFSQKIHDSSFIDLNMPLYEWNMLLYFFLQPCNKVSW